MMTQDDSVHSNGRQQGQVKRAPGFSSQLGDSYVQSCETLTEEECYEINRFSWYIPSRATATVS